MSSDFYQVALGQEYSQNLDATGDHLSFRSLDFLDVCPQKQADTQRQHIQRTKADNFEKWSAFILPRCCTNLTDKSRDCCQILLVQHGQLWKVSQIP